MGLIVDTAGGLASHLGPKYTKALKKRNTQLPEVFDNIFLNKSLKRGTFPGESGFLGVKRRSWAGAWQRGERWQPGWWPQWEHRAADQMTDLIRSDYHDEKVLRGTVKEVLGELSRGNAVLVHCAQGKYVNTNINRGTSFFLLSDPSLIIIGYPCHFASNWLIESLLFSRLDWCDSGF